MIAPNSILQNRYRIIRELGHGGMGAVYEAFDIRLNRTVALKETFAQTDELKRAFQKEAQLLANLRHPSLPNVLDHFIEGDGQFLVMEYISGPDLAQKIIQKGGPFPIPQVLQWSEELLGVIEYLHSHNPPIIHRDIKPSNLKLGREGRIILLDFGLAKGSAGGMTGSNVSRSVSGYSPHYAPLEQSYGERSGPSSDLYAAAATIYHLITGHIPEEATHRASVLISEGRDPLLLANQWNPEVPNEFAFALSRALSLKANERPASATEMRAALKNLNHAATPDETQAARRPSFGQFHQTIYPTIPVKPELIRDPFNVPASETNQKENRNWVRWAFTSILGCALIIGLYLLYLSRHISEDRTASSTSAGQPVKAVIPSPYREALSSLVSLELKDADGKSIGQASGFFIKEDEIATDLGAIQGATQASATLMDGSSLQITGVSAVDRERGLVILKVNGGKANPLPLSSTANANDKVALLSVSTGSDANYLPTTLTDTKKKDDILEIGAAVGPAMRGAPLMNSKGEVIAVLVSSTEGGNNNHAVTASRLLNLLKVNQPVSSLGMTGAKELLYDFRQEESGKEKKISAEESRRVLSAVFKSYLTDGSQCSDSTGDEVTTDRLKNARETGNIVPQITDKATGSFTEGGTQQTAYLISVGECNAAHVDNWGTKRLAVFTGQTLVLNVDIKDHTTIIGTYDLYGDGINELLITGSYAQSGLVAEWGALVSVKDKHLVLVKKFDSVRESTCASMDPKPSVTAAVIYYTRGAGSVAPEIRVDNYQAKCAADSEEPKASAFRYISSGKLPKS